MRQRFYNYTTYSIGCAVVWAVILVVVAAEAGPARLHVYLLVWAGWLVGWVSATIARYVYPPPTRRGVPAGQSGA
jgi:hypothetical protein